MTYWKLDDYDVRMIRKLSRETTIPQHFIAFRFSITQAMVSYIKNNRRRVNVS